MIAGQNFTTNKGPRLFKKALLAGLAASLLISACGTKEKRMIRDRQWAVEYLRDIPREHYPMALCAAARSQKVERLPREGRKDYKFDKISTSKSVETIKLLARLGVDLDVRAAGKTPLMLAIEDKFPDIVEALLKSGANPLIKDPGGKSASDYAQVSQNQEIIKLLDDALTNIYSEYYEISDPHRRALLDSLYNKRPIARADTSKVDTLITEIVAETQAFHYAEASQSSIAPAKKRINLGGVSNYSDYDEAPKLQSPVRPLYPPTALEDGIQGSVLLEVEVLPTGRVGEVKVIRGVQSGSGGIDEAAVSALKSAHFSPARKAGYPVQTAIQISVKFKI